MWAPGPSRFFFFSHLFSTVIKPLDNCSDKTWIWTLVSSLYFSAKLKTTNWFDTPKKDTAGKCQLTFHDVSVTHWEWSNQSWVWTAGTWSNSWTLWVWALVISLLQYRDYNRYKSPLPTSLFEPLPVCLHFPASGKKTLVHGLNGRHSKIHQDPCSGQHQVCGCLDHTCPAA